MTDEEHTKLLKSLQAVEADLVNGKRKSVDADMLATELRAVRDAVLRASAEREETPVSALKKGRMSKATLREIEREVLQRDHWIPYEDVRRELGFN